MIFSLFSKIFWFNRKYLCGFHTLLKRRLRNYAQVFLRPRLLSYFSKAWKIATMHDKRTASEIKLIFYFLCIWHFLIFFSFFVLRFGPLDEKFEVSPIFSTRAARFFAKFSQIITILFRKVWIIYIVIQFKVYKLIQFDFEIWKNGVIFTFIGLEDCFFSMFEQQFLNALKLQKTHTFYCFWIHLDKHFFKWNQICLLNFS